jgi:YD repeat-containing protein
VDQGLGTTYTLAARQTQGLATAIAASASKDLAVLTDPRTYPLTFTLDTPGRLLQQQTADGANQNYGRDPATGEVTSYVDGNGNPTLYFRGSSGDLTEVDYPDGGFTKNQYGTTTFTYHKVTQTSNAEGETTTYTYSAVGDRTTMIDALGNTTSYAYSTTGQLTKVTDPLNHATTYLYDPATRRQTATVDPLTHTTVYAYDGNGKPSTVTDPLGDVTKTGYDARSRLTMTADGAGDTTTYALDPSGNTTQITDPRGTKTINAFDQRGWRTAVTEAATKPEQRITSYTYDLAGNVATRKDANTHVTTYNYDAVGQTKTILDPLTLTTTTLYDLAGSTTRRPTTTTR